MKIWAFSVKTRIGSGIPVNIKTGAYYFKYLSTKNVIFSPSFKLRLISSEMLLYFQWYECSVWFAVLVKQVFFLWHLAEFVIVLIIHQEVVEAKLLGSCNAVTFSSSPIGLSTDPCPLIGCPRPPWRLVPWRRRVHGGSMVPLSLETGGRKLLELAQSHHSHQSAFRAYKVCSQSIQSLVNKVKN